MQLGFVPVAAHCGEETAHLGERCPPGPLDAPERIAVLGQCIREPVPDRADLEHHHADGMGNDVVKLAGNPRTLLCHRDTCRRLALPLGPGRTLLRRFGLLGTLTQGVTRDPGDHEPERDEYEVPDWQWARDVVDHDHDPDHNDDQTNARLQRIAEVPEQERARQPDQAEAADEREQQSVAERDRRGQNPIDSRGGERKASAREERQYQDGNRRYGDPQRRRRCARRVASDDELEHPRDRQERDQQLEPVSARDVSDPDHVPNVAHALLRRLLPK